MNILITGGAGFIGSAVVRYILNETSYSVLNVDKLTYAGNCESVSSVSNSRRYGHLQIDICDKQAVANIFDKYTHQNFPI